MKGKQPIYGGFRVDAARAPQCRWFIYGPHLIVSVRRSAENITFLGSVALVEVQPGAAVRSIRPANAVDMGSHANAPRKTGKATYISGAQLGFIMAASMGTDNCPIPIPVHVGMVSCGIFMNLLIFINCVLQLDSSCWIL